MKHDKIFDGVRAPEPPSNLRARVLAQAEASPTSRSPLPVESPYAVRPVAGYAWATGMAALLLILLFWNPPLPGIGAAGVSGQTSESVPEDIQWALTIPQRMAANANAWRALEGEKL